MENFGFIRVAACSPEVKPADIEFNSRQIAAQLKKCVADNVVLAVFPELSITGYTCADLFEQQLLIDKAATATLDLAREFKNESIAFVVGCPVRVGGKLYNCAIVLQEGEIKGIVPKTHIPNYGEFYERRWFVAANRHTDPASVKLYNHDLKQTEEYPFGTDLIFNIGGWKFGVEICEDLWVPNPPSVQLAMHGADIILNLSASDELIGKHRYLTDLIKNQSARCRCAYVYASAGTGESSTDLAFCGNCIVAENGSIIAESERFTFSDKLAIADVDAQALRNDRLHFSTFSEGEDNREYRDISMNFYSSLPQDKILEYRKVNPHPFVDSNPAMLKKRCEEISSIQAWGLAVRLKAIHCNKAVIGISGGLDSTLALLVTVKAFDMLGLDRRGIIGVTMPGFGTTKRTHDNASELMDLLGVTRREINIAAAVTQHFHDIGHDADTTDITYENSQARERTQILMDLANMENAIVIGTGDLSELALGWCTYNGDQMSMYGVNASIPKTLVKYLVTGYADEATDSKLRKVLLDIVDTPISPELLPASDQGTIKQKTEDTVGPYELHDFFIYHMLRYGMEPDKIYFLARKAFGDKYGAETVKKWLRTFYHRFFSQQFKRSCMPDCVKVGSVSLSPRGDWRMPSDASATLWLEAVDKIKV